MSNIVTSLKRELSRNNPDLKRTPTHNLLQIFTLKMALDMQVQADEGEEVMKLWFLSNLDLLSFLLAYRLPQDTDEHRMWLGLITDPDHVHRVISQC